MWLDKKFINLLSPRLDKFQWRGNVANCRCPICFDSPTNKSKKRGYFFEKENKWFFYCHRCGKSTIFPTLLKQLDGNLYKEYKMELAKEKYTPTPETDFSSEPEKRLAVASDLKTLLKLKTVSQLSEAHVAKKLMIKRKIPERYQEIFRYTPGFMEWTNELLPNKFSHKALSKDEGRIIIPFFDSKGIFHAYQGRSLDPKAQVRYISIVLDESIPLIWGLDTINLQEKINVFEGVMDALFIPNSLAICGGNFAALKEISDPDNIVVIFDNEPRSTEAKKKIQTAIYQGFHVCIWPKNIESKDVNEMILNEGLTPATIHRIIEDNTYHGLKANVALVEWSKV